MQTLIIITRPGASGAKLQQALQAQGLRSLHLPGLAIRGLTPSVEAIDTVGHADWWIFTSPAAIRHAAVWLQSTAIKADDYPAVAVLSKVSADHLQAVLDIDADLVIRPSAGHRSEDLLMHPQLQDLSGRRVIIFNAAGGRRLLPDTLQRRGAKVEEVTVYQRRPAELDPDCLQQLTAWTGPLATLWTSNTAIAHLRQQLSQAQWQKLMQGDHLFLSDRQKSVLENESTGNMYPADAPDNAALQQQLIRLYS